MQLQPHLPQQPQLLQSPVSQNLVSQQELQAFASPAGIVGLHMRAASHAEHGDGGIETLNHSSPH